MDDVLVWWKPLDGNFVSQVSSTQLPKLATLLQNATSFLEIGIPFFSSSVFHHFSSALFYEWQCMLNCIFIKCHTFNCSHTWVEFRFVGYCHFSFLLYLFQANPQIGHTWVKWKLFGDYNFSFLTEEEHRIFQKDKKFNLARIFAYCFIHKCHWIWILHFGIIHIYPHLIYSPDLTENKCDQLLHI